MNNKNIDMHVLFICQVIQVIIVKTKEARTTLCLKSILNGVKIRIKIGTIRVYKFFLT